MVSPEICKSNNVFSNEWILINNLCDATRKRSIMKFIQGRTAGIISEIINSNCKTLFIRICKFNDLLMNCLQYRRDKWSSVQPPQMRGITDSFNRIIYVQFFKDSLTMCIYGVDTDSQAVGDLFTQQAVAD